MKRVLIACDYKYPGGYFAIANGIAAVMEEQGIDVTIIGRGWDQSEHAFPFRIIPTDGSYLPMHTAAMAKELNPDWVLFMMDIPRIVSIFDNILVHHPDFAIKFKCGAIFPVESYPLGVEKWVVGLRRFAARFTFTEFGVSQCRAADLPVFRIGVGIDPYWYSPPIELPIFRFNHPYVLMVAENQIRKNQHGAYSMIKDANKHLVLVTEENNPDGWDLRFLAKQCGLDSGQALVLNKSMVSRDQLKHLYRNAESLVLPSLAEGIGLPLYEAQAQGCPVIATDCCGIPEAVIGRESKTLIKVDRITPYPWGNTYHFWPSVEHGAQLLVLAGENKSRESVEFHPWSVPGARLTQFLKIFDEAASGRKPEVSA